MADDTPKKPEIGKINTPPTPLVDDVDKILAEAEEKMAGTPERAKEIKEEKKNATDAGSSDAQTESPKGRPRGAIRTFHDDVAETVKTRQISLGDIAVAETKRRESKGVPSEERKPVSSPVKVAVVVGVLLIAMLAVGGGVVWYRSLTASAVPPTPVRTISIPVNEEKIVTLQHLSRSSMLDAIEAEVERTQTPLGSVRDVRLQGEGTGVDLTAPAFLAGLDVRAPEALLRTLGDTFVLGVHGFASDEVFLLFSVRDFRSAFAGMLSWENFLTADLPFIAHGNGIAPIDLVIRNKDVRALVDAEGVPVLYYAFPDEKNLIIAGSENTLIEIFDRLTRPQFR